MAKTKEKIKAKTELCKGSTAKRYEELTFADDFMFGKVMEDKELCREVLECLLQEPVGELTEMQRLNHKKLGELELPKRSRFYQSMMDADFLQKGILP